jgi:hypothetical protein
MAWIVGSVSAAEQLQWQWQPGTRWQVELKQSSDQQTTVGPRALTLSGSQRIVALWSVDQVTEDGTVHMGLVIQRLQLNLNLGELGKIEFDSELAKDPAGLTTVVAGPLRALVGAKITQRIASDAAVQEVVLPETARQSLEANPLARRLFFRGLLSDLKYHQSLRLPAGAIEPGFEWKSASQIVTELGQTPVTTHYRYRGTGANAATVDPLHIIEVQVEVGTLPPELLAQVPIKLVDHKLQGTVWFNNELGRISVAHFEQTQTVETGADDQRIVQRLSKTTDVTISEPLEEPPPPDTPVTLPSAAQRVE